MTDKEIEPELAAFSKGLNDNFSDRPKELVLKPNVEIDIIKNLR